MAIRTCHAIGVADGFRRYHHDLAHDADRYYRRALLAAEWAVRRAFHPKHRVKVAALSVFTTQTSSHIIERIRDAIQEAPAPTLDFGVGPGGARAVFNAAQIESLTNNAHLNVSGPLTPQPQNLAAMRIVPGAVGTVAFGTFRTLDFTTRPSGHIAPIPTRTGTLAPTGTLDTAFDLWLPDGTPPAGGWPVAIYGHGSFGSKNSPITHAAVLTSHGVAVLAINAVGRGGGPLTSMTIRLTDGTTTTFAAPGLGYDANGDGTIGDREPRRAQRPHALLNTSGPIAQAAAQHFALVRAIHAGVDVDDDGAPDLDRSRIYYLGQSLGAMWGMVVFAHEPAIRAAVFNVPAGTLPYNNLLAPVDRPGFGTDLLAARTPSLLNSLYGLTSLDGVPLAAPHFNENLPPRNEMPRVNTVPGAIAIQRVVDRVVWATQFTNTVAVAPMLRRALPAGVPERPFVFQWARSESARGQPERLGDHPGGRLRRPRELLPPRPALRPRGRPGQPARLPLIHQPGQSERAAGRARCAASNRDVFRERWQGCDPPRTDVSVGSADLQPVAGRYLLPAALSSRFRRLRGKSQAPEQALKPRLRPKAVPLEASEREETPRGLLLVALFQEGERPVVLTKRQMNQRHRYCETGTFRR